MSSPSPIVSFAIRGFQTIFASIVLGLSVGLIRGQLEGISSPISLRYCAFVGGISLVAGFIGIAAEFVSALQGIVVLSVDALITLVNIAGGVLLAVLIGGANCSDTSDRNRAHLVDNDLFNGGCVGKGEDRGCYNELDDRLGQLNARCKMCQADSVFMFFIVALLLAGSTMTFLRMKKGY